MGHISDLPGDILWLILRHAMYVDYRSPYLLDDVIRDRNDPFEPNFSLVRAEETNLICVIVRYATVNRRWLRIIASKVRSMSPPGCLPRWGFVNGSWADFRQ
jgi:hypothetical protein